VTARYVTVTPFPDALRNWSGKPLPSLPADMAPCGYLPGIDEENRVLARVFTQLCALGTTTDRLAYLGTTIQVHERRLQMAWDTAKGHGDTRTMLSSDRSAMARLRPYEAMIEALKMWLDELHEAATAEIGVEIIDQAARRA
jgi:hypothetical protein